MDGSLALKIQTSTHAHLEPLWELASVEEAPQVPEPSGGLSGVAVAPARAATGLGKRGIDPDLDTDIQGELHWSTDESAPTSLDYSELSTATDSTVLELAQRLEAGLEESCASAKGLLQGSADLVSGSQREGWGCTTLGAQTKFKDVPRDNLASEWQPDESCK